VNGHYLVYLYVGDFLYIKIKKIIMIKSFDDFDKLPDSGKKSAAKDVVNEQIFAQNKAKQVMTVNGKKHKVVWKDRGSGNHVIRIVNDLDVVDQDRLTPTGQIAITNFLNGQEAFNPKWDQAFFKDNLVVYTVRRDTGRTQKIALTNSLRSKYPDVDATINFISTAELEGNYSATQQGILNVPIEEDPNVTDETDKVTTDPNTVISDDFKGRTFKYTWQSPVNTSMLGMGYTVTASTCTITITEQGAFHYELISNDSIAGTIHYINKEVKVYPEGESTHESIVEPDYEFWLKCFTDAAFLREQLGETEETEETGFDGTFTLDNIKDYLYNKETYVKLY